jgi:hypothetical protein
MEQGKMLNAMMVKRIKALQRAAGVDEESYRAMLAGYGVESCRGLDFRQAMEVVAALRRFAGQDRRPGGSRRYDDLGHRAGMATPKQLRMLEAMWMEVTRQTTRTAARSALGSFLLHRWQVTGLEMLRRDQVSAVRRALSEMQGKPQ